MKKRNILGYILMIIALSVPIYMLTNMSLNKFAPKNNYEKYIEKSNNNVQKFKEVKSEIEKYNEKITNDNSNIVDPFGTEEYKASYDLDVDEDFVLGYVRIPKLDINYPLKLGTSDENIRYGFGHVDGTSIPDSGRGTRSVISAHRVTRTDIMLFYIDEMQKGDVLFLDLGYKVIQYRYKETERIKPSEWEKLLPVNNEELITILSCDPPYPPFPNRILVTFEKEKEMISEESKIKKEDTTSNSEITPRKNLTKLYKGEYLSPAEKKEDKQLLPIIVLITTVVLWIGLIIVVIKFVKRLRKK